MTRRLIATLLATLVGAVALIGVAAPAQAADYFRYWAFFTAEDGQYVYSQLGVGGVTPADGSIVAFRYAAPADYNNPNQPRIDLATVTFESVCADTPAADGQKRVVVLVDFGVAEDSEGATTPEATAACSQVAEDFTAFQVLQKVAEVRSKTSSFGPQLCGIDGYPASGCGEAKVQNATPADAGFVNVASDEPADEAEEDSNTALYAGLGVVVVLLLAGGGFVAARRGKTAA